MINIGDTVTTNNGYKGIIQNFREPTNINESRAYTLLLTHKYDGTKIAGKVSGWVKLNKTCIRTFNQRFIN